MCEAQSCFVSELRHSESNFALMRVFTKCGLKCEVMGMRCGILVDRGVAAQADGLKNALAMQTTESKPTAALSQALALLSALPGAGSGEGADGDAPEDGTPEAEAPEAEAPQE